MKVLNVNKSWIVDNSNRLDAKPYLSEGKIVLKHLLKNKGKLNKLRFLSKEIFYGGRDKRVYVDSDKKGIPFMGSSDMLKSDFSALKLVSIKYTKKLNEQLLKKDWILISRSGTIGNTVYTNIDFENKAASEHIIRVIPNGKVPSGYLYAYLSSKYGYNLLTQGTYGAVIQHIEPHHIEDLPVPILPEEKQQQIHQLIVDSANLRVEANKLLKEAVDYFDNLFPVEGITKIFKKNVKQLNFSWASYNNNIEADSIYKNNEIERFASLREFISKCFAPPLFKHIYLDKDNGHPFLTGAELTKFNKKFYRWLSPRGVKNINDYKVSKGTLLLYKSGTTDGGILGNVFIADAILDSACLSDHVIRIMFEDLNMAYWFYAFFKSKIGVRLLQKTATGSMIPFITPERLLDIKVPIPDDNYFQIIQLISESIQKSEISQIKENQAINLIENEIDAWQ